MPIIRSQFKPAWWLRNPHTQTLWASVIRLKPKLKMKWQRVELPDGDFIDLVWSGPKNGKTVLILHGLEGSIESNYASGLMRELERHGYQSCLMHFRGCSGESNRLPFCYHSGKTDDLQYILKYLQDQMNIDAFAAIGFSLGGNVLLKWLSEQGGSGPLKRAAVMSVPFQLEQAAERMDRGFSRFYQRHLLNKLLKSYKKKFNVINCPLDIDINSINSFLSFDDKVTAPLHGFKDVHDYYARASGRQFIPKIQVPTLILHAADDPFMYPHSPPNVDELPENVWLEIPQKGGHVGFITGAIPGWGEYWGERRLAEWIDKG